MDTRSAAPFAVLLKDRQGWDPLALAKAFAAARKTPLQDQMAAAKRSWGIIADKLAEDEARELAALLSGAGLESVVRPASSLPELPPVEPAVNALALKHAAPALIAVAAIRLRPT